MLEARNVSFVTAQVSRLQHFSRMLATGMGPRYAIYFSPAPDSAWGHFGGAWLSRESDLLRAPRRYGFHATLKAPFWLAGDARLGELTAALDRFCAARTAFELPAMEVRRLRDFLAVVPLAPDARLAAIAAECVQRFDRWRAPLSDDEIRRRRERILTPREEANLARWGYPHVLEDFCFHLSLTGPHEPGEAAARLARAAEAAVAELGDAPLCFDAITVFEEPAPDAMFRELHRSPLRRRGRLVYVIGPSGAGKDTLLAWVRERLPAQSALAFARRTITRPAGEGERHEPASEREFEARRARGEFAMHWEANGHRYGIGREILDQLEAGITVVVNGSRAHLSQARLAFRDLEVVHVTAPALLRGQRLARRAREAPAETKRRLARELHVPAAALELENDGALELPAASLLRYLVG
jgi:phosphonate metabolism protein PhnN/1,5-bisphosphokinase (PRPP-forming)